MPNSFKSGRVLFEDDGIRISMSGTPLSDLGLALLRTLVSKFCVEGSPTNCIVPAQLHRNRQGCPYREVCGFRLVAVPFQ